MLPRLMSACLGQPQSFLQPGQPRAGTGSCAAAEPWSQPGYRGRASFTHSFKWGCCVVPCGVNVELEGAHSSLPAVSRLTSALPGTSSAKDRMDTCCDSMNEQV